MTQQATQPQPIREPCPCDDQRILWLAVRRGLMTIVKAIEARYEVGEGKKAA